jgi:dyslexia susceptibility 1 candidate gene 1 protein
MPVTPRWWWAQRERVVEVQVALPGVPESAIDSFLSRWYAKVGGGTFLFAADLHGPIDPDASRARTRHGHVSLELCKAAPQPWGSLLSSAPKAERRQTRERSIEEQLERARESDRQSRARKQQLGHDALSAQMRVESDRRQAIAENQEAALDQAASAVASLRSPDAAEGSGAQGSADLDDDSDDDNHPSATANVRAASASASSDLPGKEHGWKQRAEAGFSAALFPQHCVHHEESEDQQGGSETARSLPREATVAPDAPPPRGGASVTVEFTQLEQSVMPARRSREQGIKEHTRGSGRGASPSDQPGGDEEDATGIAEKEPVFLTDKGDSFVRNGDLRGALEAYNEAERQTRAAPKPDGTLCKLLSNRSAVQLRIGNLSRAVSDCSEALGLVDAAIRDDEGDALHARKCKLLMRRADANAQRNRLEEAADDYRTAARLGDEEESQIAQRNLAEIEACCEPLDAEGAKERGNARLRAGDASGALAAYSEALRIRGVPLHSQMACMSNAALCHISAGDYGAAIDCCDRTLRCAAPIRKAVQGKSHSATELPFRESHSLSHDCGAGSWVCTMMTTRCRAVLLL